MVRNKLELTFFSSKYESDMHLTKSLESGKVTVPYRALYLSTMRSTPGRFVCDVLVFKVNSTRSAMGQE